MEPPPEMMERAEGISALVDLYRMVPPGVVFMFQLGTAGEDGWLILRGNISDEGLREAIKELASKL